MQLASWEQKELAIDRIEELLDPILREPQDRTSSSHDLVLDAAGDELLSALYDAQLLRLGEPVAGPELDDDADPGTAVAG